MEESGGGRLRKNSAIRINFNLNNNIDVDVDVDVVLKYKLPMFHDETNSPNGPITTEQQIFNPNYHWNRKIHFWEGKLPYIYCFDW